MEHHRLTSLTMKRDLSLGASKPKKIYKPNLNVVRNKDKSKEMIKLVQEQVKQKRDRHANRQNFRKEQPKNIQVSGVFSQGFGSGESRQKPGFERSYTRDVDNPSDAPKIKKKWTWENSEDDKMDYDPLNNKDDDTSEEEGEYQPIRLPLHANNESFLKSYRNKSAQILNGVKLKSENELKCSSDNSQVNSLFNLGKYQIYDDEHPSLSLIKMPNSLSGKGFDENDKKVDYNLSHMNEGQIGTIKLRQSGKVEVNIGNMVYLMESIGENSFKEELVYVPENLKLSFGQDVSTLGNINDKYMLLPSWKNLFEQKSTQKIVTGKTVIKKELL